MVWSVQEMEDELAAAQEELEELKARQAPAEELQRCQSAITRCALELEHMKVDRPEESHT